MDQYSFDIVDIANKKTPELLVRTRMQGFLLSVLKPLADIWALFTSFRLDSYYEAAITPQTIWLEKVLNDRVDNDLRRISVIHQSDDVLIGYFDNEGQAAIVGYLDSEGQAANIGYFELESGSSLPYDFRVLVKIPSIASIVSYFDSEGQAAIVSYFDSEGQTAIVSYFDSETPFLVPITAIVNRYKQAGKKFDISF